MVRSIMALKAQEFETDMLTNRKFSGDFVSTLMLSSAVRNSDSIQARQSKPMLWDREFDFLRALIRMISRELIK